MEELGKLNINAEAIPIQNHNHTDHTISVDIFDIDSHASLYPSNLIPIFFERKDRQTATILQKHAYKVCKTKIPISYSKWAFNKFQKGLYYHNDKGEPIGFCIWTETRDLLKAAPTNQHTVSRIHILLICAEKGKYKLGSKILFDMETYSAQHKFNSIELEPVNDKVEDYYVAHGYDLASIKPVRTMIKMIAPVNIVLPSSVSAPRKTRRRNRTRSL